MTRPAEVNSAIKRMSAAIALSGIAKTGQNEQDGYAFRTIDDILESLSQKLAEHDLIIVPTTLSREHQERRLTNGLPAFYVTVEVRYDFVSTLDESVRSAVVFGEGMDTSDKATAKAMTAAYKTAVTQVFCIATKGVADPDTVTHQPSASMSADERLKHERAIGASPDVKTLKSAHTLATAAASRVGDAEARKAFTAKKNARTEELKAATEAKTKAEAIA